MGKNKNKKQSHGIPENFLERLQNIVGVSLFQQIKQTFVERPTTFRINTIKAKRDEVIEVLNQNGFKFERVRWYKDAFILKNKSKRELTDLEIYKDGKIYIQSLASMIPPLVLDPQPGEKVLDLTAAPGSKTSQIAALMQNTGELVANDNNKIRFFKLKHNMDHLVIPRSPQTTRNLSEDKNIGTQNFDVMQQMLASKDPSSRLDSVRDFLKLRLEYGSDLAREYPEYFDRVLLDAPCSAEARFVESDPKTFGYWKEQKIKEMAYKQRQLLFAAWSALKPGGILVYSTCTFAPEENELQISRFMEQNTNCELLEIDLKDVKRLPIVKNWHNKEINKEVIKKTMRILPTKEIEAFFVAKLKKKL